MFLFSSILDARTYRKRRTVKRPNPMDILNKALRENDNSYEGDYSTVRPKKKRRTKRYKRKKKSSKKKNISPEAASSAVNDEMKLQKSLSALGYYHGAIDGEVNNFETRAAIKTMNEVLGNENILFLEPQVKEMLIYLADLYKFDKNLISNDISEGSKNIKLQTALKVLGFYHDEIDGLIGPVTHGSILQYKEANKINKDNNLTLEEEEHQLISKARNINNQYIEEAKKGLGITTKNQLKSGKKKSTEDNNMHTIKKDGNMHTVPILEKIQRPKSNIGLSDSFE